MKLTNKEILKNLEKYLEESKIRYSREMKRLYKAGYNNDARIYNVKIVQIQDIQDTIELFKNPPF